MIPDHELVVHVTTARVIPDGHPRMILKSMKGTVTPPPDQRALVVIDHQIELKLGNLVETGDERIDDAVPARLIQRRLDPSTCTEQRVDELPLKIFTGAGEHRRVPGWSATGWRRRGTAASRRGRGRCPRVRGGGPRAVDGGVGRANRTGIEPKTSSRMSRRHQRIRRAPRSTDRHQDPDRDSPRWWSRNHALKLHERRPTWRRITCTRRSGS